MEKEAFCQNYDNGFLSEIEKFADLIPGQVYKDLNDWGKSKLVEIKQTVEEATKKDTKLPVRIRRKMLDAAFDSLKNQSWRLARTAIPKKVKVVLAPDETNKKPPATL